MIEWKAVREAASRFLPKHFAAAGWKHRNLSHVEQEGVLPMLKERGAEQGDVDGSLECSSVETRRVWLPSRRQVAFRGLVLTTFQKRNICRLNTQPNCRESSILQLDGPEKLTGADDPRHALQENGGVADLFR